MTFITSAPLRSDVTGDITADSGYARRVSVLGKFGKLAARFREQGPKDGLKSIVDDAKTYVVDDGREAICLKVDLTNPKNHLRPRDEAKPVTIRPFDRDTLPGLLDMLQTKAPSERDRVRQRYLEGMLGFLAYVDEEIIGYVFYTPGSDDPERIIHPDLTWLPIRPRATEVYAFDYFLQEEARGRGATFVRAVQQEQSRLGYTASFGYVYAHNRPALWLYRTTGWKEAGRVAETRILNKLALVDRTVFWMHPHSRQAIWTR